MCKSGIPTRTALRDLRGLRDSLKYMTGVLGWQSGLGSQDGFALGQEAPIPLSGTAKEVR